MTKIHIPDGAAERLQGELTKAGQPLLGTVVLRKILEAALNPPPEIPVSARMEAAGCSAFNDCARNLNYAPGILPQQMASAYRAMEKKRREELPERRTGKLWNHFICSSCGAGSSGPTRRKTDPK